MVKDDWPPYVWLTSIWPKIWKLRFSLYMLKYEWTPIRRYDQPISHLKFERNLPDEHLTKNFKIKV